MTSPDTYERILQVAERLFIRKGYKAVTLREIAQEVGVQYTNLYYYAPKGKQQLYVDAIERSLTRHRAGMENVILEAPPDLFAQLEAIAYWLIENSAMNIQHIQSVDLEALDAVHARRLSIMLFDALRMPVRNVLAAAQEKGEIVVANLDTAALMFVSLVQAMTGASHYHAHVQTDDLIDVIIPSPQENIRNIVATFLYGWTKR